MPENCKISTLSQDLIRRMLNTSEMVTQQERDEIVENYVTKLVVSGYSLEQIRNIIVSGLKGYQTRLERAARDGTKLHRPTRSTLAARQKKKLLSKTNWYKSKKRDEDKNEKEVSNKKSDKPGKNRQRDDGNKEPDVTSVLFVPRTENGEFAKRMKKAEEEISTVTGDRVKVVEKSGTMLKDILHKSNPWAGGLCGREDCLVCMHGGDDCGDCSKRNIVYQTTCLDCKEKGKTRRYYGESSRTGYERGQEHVRDYKKESDDSHMHKHWSTEQVMTSPGSP